jgi:hypothetical protein
LVSKKYLLFGFFSPNSHRQINTWNLLDKWLCARFGGHTRILIDVMSTGKIAKILIGVYSKHSEIYQMFSAGRKDYWMYRLKFDIFHNMNRSI